MSKGKLAVAEAFYSIQGEGQTIGKRAYFLRLAGCNLMCGGKGTEKDGKLHNGATWRCDSIEVWMKGKSLEFWEVVDKLGGQKFIRNMKLGAHLVITGGEPLLQQDELASFLLYLNGICEKALIYEAETNGTILPKAILHSLISYWNVSPKLSNSGEPVERRLNYDVLRFFSNLGNSVIFKYVISNINEYDEILKEASIPAAFSRNQIYLMPAGSTQEELAITAPIVAEIAKNSDCHYSHRVHISIWNQKTGV